MSDRPDDNPPPARLLKLTWRYAALIDIVTAEAAGLAQSEVEHDRKEWPHLVKEENGMPVFELVAAAKWMAELSGAREDECRRALKWEWPI